MRELKLTLLAAFLFSLLCSNLIFPQDKTTEYNPLAENKWAVIFEAGSLFRNNSGGIFKTFLLTGKYNFSKKHGLRIFGGTSGTQYSGAYHDLKAPWVDYDSDQFNIETGLQYIRYFNPDNEIKVYLAAGPYFMLNYRNSINQSTGGPEKSFEYSREWELGISVSLGVEYFILDNISIIGEYFTSATGGKNSYRLLDYDSRYESESTNYKFNANRMQLGFSVYF